MHLSVGALHGDGLRLRGLSLGRRLQNELPSLRLDDLPALQHLLQTQVTVTNHERNGLGKELASLQQGVKCYARRIVAVGW